MEFFNYFFRGTEDSFVFKLFSPIHLLLLGIFLGGVLLIKFKFNRKTVGKINVIFALVLLVDQIILYIWQLASGYFRLDMSLPLYHCRVAVWLLIIGILFDKRTIKLTGFYLGFVGSLFGLLFADLYKFSFPHYTNFQFFIVHIFMGWIVAGILFEKRNSVTKEEIKKILLLLNGLNILILVANILLLVSYPEVNYGYFFRLPGGMGPSISPALNAFLMLLLFNVGLLALYKLLNAVIRREQHENI